VLVAAKLLFWKDIEAFGWWLGCKAVVGVSDFEVFSRLKGCEAAGLLPGAARLHIGAAKLHSCTVAWLQGCKVAGYTAARLQGCRLHGCKAA